LFANNLCVISNVWASESLKDAALSQLAAQRKVNAAAIDGKALRASARHVLHVFAQNFWRLLDLFEVDAKKNEDWALR
jgi:hypothetical protein